MTSPFDQLPGAMRAAFGEAVLYTPVATGRPLTIQAIWNESYVADGLSGGPSSDAVHIVLDVVAADLPVAPQEGDLVRRVASGFDGQVVPPIKPDNIGIISLTVQQVRRQPF